MGLLGGTKLITPKWGSSNLDEIHVPTLQHLLTGQQPQWYEGMFSVGNRPGLGPNGKTAADTISGGLNLFDIIANQQSRDGAAFGNLRKFTANNMSYGNSLLDAIAAKSRSNTAMSVGMAKKNKNNVMSTLNGGYDTAVSGVEGMLSRNLRDIGRSTGLQAALSGVKSFGTNQKSRSRKTAETQRMSEVLGNILMRKAETTAGFEQSTGNTVLSTLMNRLAGDENTQKGIFDSRMGLRSNHVSSLLNLDAQRRQFETGGIQTLMQGVLGIPQYGTSPIVTQEAGVLDGIGQVIGLGSQIAGLGSNIAGFFSPGASGMRNFQNNLGSALGNINFVPPGFNGPLQPNQFNIGQLFPGLFGR